MQSIAITIYYNAFLQSIQMAAMHESDRATNATTHMARAFLVILKR